MSCRSMSPWQGRARSAWLALLARKEVAYRCVEARGLASGDEGCANGYEDIVDIAGQRLH